VINSDSTFQVSAYVFDRNDAAASFTILPQQSKGKVQRTGETKEREGKEEGKSLTSPSQNCRKYL
jgi:hypothetical protein